MSNYFQTSSTFGSITPEQRKERMEVKALKFSELGFFKRINSIPLKLLCEKYLEAFEQDGSSTRRAKSYDFKEFLLYVGHGDVDRPTLSDFTKSKVDAFRDYRADQGEAHSTVNRRLATLKHFSRVLADRIEHFHNDIQYVDNFHLANLVSKVLTDDEREALILHANHGQNIFLRTRNLALVHTLAATGLRADEILSICMRHFDNGGRWLMQLKTKGRKLRNVYLSTSTDEVLADYHLERTIEMNRRCPGHMYLSPKEKGAYPLFVSFHGARIDEPESFKLSYESLRELVYRIGERANVEGVHPHRFRHDLATRLRRETDAVTGADMLGITLQTFHRYSKSTSTEQADAFEKINRRAAK